MDLREIYDRQNKRVYRVAMLYLKNSHDAEDAVQSIFIKWLEHNVAFSGIEYENAWLFTDDGEYSYSNLYSEKSRQWINGNGEEQITFLAVANGEYIFYSYFPHVEKIVRRQIELNGMEYADSVPTGEIAQGHEKEQTTETDENIAGINSLPEFVYTGEDPAIPCIIAYFKQEMAAEPPYGDVWIPEFVILKEVQEGDEYLIFGNFYSFWYEKIGSILESDSGGECPACFHLKKTTEGYEVVGVDLAGDGDDYSRDIKKFTKGYPGLYRKFMDHDGIYEEWTKARMEFLKMYIKENDLDIEYYKDYGWDAVRIE